MIAGMHFVLWFRSARKNAYLLSTIMSAAAGILAITELRQSFSPDIFHVHDWHTALVPVYLKTLYNWDTLFENTKTVLTIHNIGYQGVFGNLLLQSGSFVFTDIADQLATHLLDHLVIFNHQ